MALMMRNNLEYWVSCRIAARSERKAQPPNASRSAARAFGRHRGQARQKRGENALSVGLADRAQPHRGRNEVGEDGDDESGQRGLQPKPWPADAAPTATA